MAFDNDSLMPLGEFSQNFQLQNVSVLYFAHAPLLKLSVFRTPDTHRISFKTHDGV